MIKKLLTADTFGAASLYHLKIWSPLTDLLSRRIGLINREKREVVAAAIGCVRMALELGDRVGVTRAQMAEVVEHVMSIHYTPGGQLPTNDTAYIERDAVTRLCESWLAGDISLGEMYAKMHKLLQRVVR